MNIFEQIIVDFLLQKKKNMTESYSSLQIEQYTEIPAFWFNYSTVSVLFFFFFSGSQVSCCSYCQKKAKKFPIK